MIRPLLATLILFALFWHGNGVKLRPYHFPWSSHILQQHNTPRDGYIQMEWFSANGPVATVINKYGKNCSLSIFFEETMTTEAHTLHQTLYHQPVQLYRLNTEILLQAKTWTRSGCDFSVFLINDGHILMNHASVNHMKNVAFQPGYYPPALWNFRAYHIIFLLVSNSTNQMALNIATQYNFKKTENLVILQPSINHVVALTHSLYTEGSELIFLDSWINGKFLKGQDLFPSKLDNLQGAVLKVATFPHPPSVVYELDNKNQIQSRLGVDMEIMHGLAQAKNFSIKFIEISFVEKWGFKYPNGTWDGLMGEIVQEKSDIGVCNVFNEHFRWNDVDFSYPYNFMPGCFVVPSPKPVLNWQSPILPFTWDTWISVGVFLVIGGIFLYIVSTLSVNQESSNFQNLVYNFLYILGSLTFGSVTIVPSHDPARIYTGFLWLCCFIISTAYSANLVAFLSVTKMAPPIDTLQHLATSSLRFGAHSFWLTQYSDSPDPYVYKIFEKLETDFDIFDLFEKVEEGTFALVENKQYLQVNRDARFTYGDKVTIRIVGECISSYSISLILSKNSPLTHHLGYNLLRMFESGMMNKWQNDVVKFYRKLYEGKRILRATKDTSPGPKALTLSQLQGVFYILGFGSLLTAFILVLEIMFKPSGSII